jgi:hypothetical protein
MSLKDDGQTIKTTLSIIFNEQGDAEISRLLDSARAEIEYLEHDNWDGGIDYYGLQLWITPQRFAAMEDQIDQFEKRVTSKLARLDLERGSERLTTVRILVDKVINPTAVRLPFPTPTDEARIWTVGRLRLFVSHVSRVKASAARLKAALEPLGVDAFVAHNDIEPTLEWALEIELALRSMHALCAVITPDFHSSLWCDQEVGFALGRPVPVLTVRSGADPYGLMGKAQAIPGADNADAMAERVFSVLMKLESCRTLVMGGLIAALETAGTYAAARQASRRIAGLQQHLTHDHILRMLQAARSNSQVREASYVPEQVEAIAKAAGIPVSKQGNVDIPF